MIRTGVYLERSFDKTLPDGSVKHVNDVVHLKQKVAPTKFQATVLASRKRYSDVIDIKTLEGALELSKFEFEELARSIG